MAELIILIDGKQADLSDNISLDIQSESPLFYSDKIPGTKSYTFVLPATRNNRKIFGYSDRISSANFSNKYSCVIYYGVLFKKSGELKVINSANGFEVFFVSDTLGWMKEMKLNEFDFGRVDLFSWYTPENTTDDRWISNAILNIAVDHDSPCSFSPVYNKYTLGEQFKNDYYPYISLSEHILEVRQRLDYQLRTRHFVNYSTGEIYFVYNPDNNDKTNNYGYEFPSLVPFLRLRYFISRLFKDYSIRRNFFSEEDVLRYPCLYTNTNKRSKQELFYHSSGEERYVELKEFMPVLAINEVFKDILNILCASVFVSNRKVEILSNKEVVLSQDCEDWTEKVTNIEDLGSEDGNNYDFAFGQVGNDNVISSLDSSPLLDFKTYNSWNEGPPGSGQLENDCMFIPCLEQYYKKIETDKYPPCYLYRGNDDSSLKTNCVTILPDICVYDMGDSHSESYGRKQVPYAGDIPGQGKYFGLLNDYHSDYVQYVNYKMRGSSHNYSVMGEKIGDLTFHPDWNNPDSFLYKYHREWRDYCAKIKRVIKCQVMLSAKELANIDYKKKKLINGKKFFIKEISYVIKKDGISLPKVLLIEA